MKKLGSLLLLVLAMVLAVPFPALSSESTTRKEINAALDKIEAGIKELETKSKDLSAAAKKQWDDAMADLRKNRDKILAELKEEKQDSKEKAKDYWRRIRAAVAELEKGLSSAGDKLKGENK